MKRPRTAALTGAALSAALVLAGLTAGAASAATQQASAVAAAPSNAPNVAPVTGGALSQVCSAPTSKDVASCLAVRVNNGRRGFGVRLGTAQAPSGYGPSDLLSAYGLPGNGGEGATIAIVDAYDNPNAAADLAVYRKQFGLPALQPGQFRKVNQEGYPGNYPAADPNWATETSLDLDMVSAIAPRAGGLVEGNVTDANTGSRLDGTSLTIAGHASSTATSAQMDGAGDAFYSLFSPAGQQTVNGTLLDYGPGQAKIDVAADMVTRSDIAMPGGRLATSGNISATVSASGGTTKSLTLTNTGDYPATFAIDQFPGSGTGTGSGTGSGTGQTDAAMMPAGTTAAGAQTVAAKPGTAEPVVQWLRAARDGARQTAAAAAPTDTAVVNAALAGIAPTRIAQADAALGDMTSTGTKPTATAPATAPASTAATSAAPGWSTLTGLPTATYLGIAASYGGRAYEGLGAFGVPPFALTTSNLLYSYDPTTGAWTQEASAPVAVAEGGYGVIGDKLYATGCTGGSGSNPTVVTTTQAYDFTTNTWSQVAADPYQICGTDVVLDGKLYQIGGLDISTLAETAAVSVYDPSTNTWSKAPAYPAAVYLESCGAISGTVYCAGGFGNGATSAATSAAYSYTPGDATWSAISSLPMPLEGSAFSVADGELLLSGGEPAYPDLTTAGYKYNPVMNWWTPLPPAPAAEFGAVAAPGFYTFGGLSSSGIIGATADVLSGYDQAGPVSLPWLSLSQTSGTIKPGGKITIQIRLNAAGAGLSPGGTVTAVLGFESATPYAVTPVTVSLTAR